MSFLKELDRLGRGKGSRKQVIIEIYKDKIRKEKEFSGLLSAIKNNTLPLDLANKKRR